MFIPRSPQFTPFATGPPVGGYQAWYDAADTSTITLSGSDVTVWADKAKMGNDLAFVTLAPTYTNRKINNITCVEFTPTSRMDCNNIPMTDVTATWFFVALQDVAAAVSMLVAGNSAAGLLFYTDAGRALIWSDAFNGGGFTSTLTVTNGVAFQTTLKIDSPQTPSSYIRLNRVEQTGSGAQSLTAGQNLHIGSSNVGSLDGLIGEIIYYPTPLSATDIVRVETYLKSKWGTP